MSTYRLRIKQRKWWWSIFSYILSVPVNNSYQFMKIKGTSMFHYDFIETLYYCKSFGQPSIQGREITSKQTDIFRYDGKNHLISQRDQAKLCRHCKGRASFICRKCDVSIQNIFKCTIIVFPFWINFFPQWNWIE